MIFSGSEIAGPPCYQLVDETYQFQIKKYAANEDTDVGHYEFVDEYTSGESWWTRR